MQDDFKLGDLTLEIVIIHLSDIHISGVGDPILSKADSIAAALNSRASNAKLLIIIVSGDIANTGSKKEYEAAKPFFQQLREIITAEVNCPVEYIFVPGNHDCDFEKNNSARDNNIAAISGGGAVDHSVIESCTAIQEEFFSFRDSLESQACVSDDRLWRSTCFDLDGRVVRFDALNVSWVSKKREDKNLVFPISNYSGKEEEACDARFIVLHHPLNWYSPIVYRPIRKFIRTISSMVISGHEHEGNFGVNDDQESFKSSYIEGMVLQRANGDLSGTGFFIVRVDVEQMTVEADKFEYKKGRYVRVEDATTGIRSLPAPANHVLRLSPEFKDQITDPGAVSKQALGETITLGDIYVFPHIRKLSVETKVRLFPDSSRLLDPGSIAGGVIIESDERGGATSLLYRLFQEYLEKGFAPVYIRGSSIKKNNAGDLEALIRNTLREQYARESQLDAEQMTRANRVLLLDDFDESPIVDAGLRAELLAHIQKMYDYAVITVGRNFELKEVIEKGAERQLVALDHYQIQPFGHAKRAELVKRWVSIGSKGAIGEAEFISQCDRSERLISAAMKKSLIPTAPLYLLTLLQSVEAGRSSELKESALGHYYQFLLSEALQNAKVPPAKLGEYFQYVTHLAWEFHSAGAQVLTYFDIGVFTERFTRDWTRMELGSTLKILLDARILQASGDDYCFRYPYMFYHLKGKYISDNLSDSGVREYVERCCKHLYVRDSANTILFLAHHTHDDWFLGSISSAITGLFENMVPVTFDSDMSRIDALISEAPTLSYKGGSPAEHRDRRARMQDEIEGEDEEDGLVEAEEKTEKISLQAQVAMLFKTTEILGQILKNQYSTIMRSKKRELIKEQFSGPLRALAYIYRDFERSPDRFIEPIKRAMERRGKGASSQEREAAARKMIADMVQAISVGVIASTARAANSDDLAEDVGNVVAESGTTAFKLLELAMILDSAKPLPKAKLEALFADSRQNIVVRRIILFLVIGRLYMFKTTETDMKWVSSKLGIPLTQQHQISYQNAGRQLS